MRKRIFITALGFIFIAIFIWLNSPTYNSRKEIFLNINSGMSSSMISRILKKERFIRSRIYFQLLSKLTGISKQIKTGIYKISSHKTPLEILTMLKYGKVYMVPITVPEGFNIIQIAELLEEKGLVKKEDFIKSTRDVNLLKKYRINLGSAEGFLFPDTYYFEKTDIADKIVDMMIARFFQFVDEKYIKRAQRIGLSLEQMVILASLVELEAKVDYERPVISAIFKSRFQKNMRLEACATVQYALKKHKERLLFNDLKVNSSYNTYIHPGLPPGPICSPGLKSIIAVLFPAKVDFLYFVSKGNGWHYFSKTFREHLLAKKQYQFLMNEILTKK